MPPKINSRSKGKRGELEWSKVLIAEGFHAFRGAQHSGKNHFTGESAPDVICPDLLIHYEVKRVEKLNLQDALSQSQRDSNEDEISAVAHRKNNSKWMVTTSAADHFRLVRESSFVVSKKEKNENEKKEKVT